MFTFFNHPLFVCLFVSMCVFQERRVLQGVWANPAHMVLLVLMVLLEITEMLACKDFLDLKVNKI